MKRLIKFRYQIWLILIVLSSILFLSPNLVLAQSTSASLSLSPASGTFSKGCSFNVDIILDTGGQSSPGADVNLLYDPSRFQAQSVTKGSLYKDFVGNNIDNTKGQVTLNAVSSETPFTGKGKFATINFSVVADAPAGTSQIKLDFDPADKTKTSDSNILAVGGTTDILASVSNGNYVVGSGSCKSPVLVQGSASSSGTTSGSLPQSGFADSIYLMLGLGTILTVVGYLGYNLKR